MWTKTIREIPEVRLLGRFDPRQPDLPMHWTRSGVRLRIRCVRLDAELTASHGVHPAWLMVRVDGAQVARMVLPDGRHWFTLLDGMDPTVPHTVEILRDTQPIEGEPEISVVLHALRSDGEMEALPAPKLRIECIGDSLTSGEGIVGPHDAMEWISAWMSGENYPQFLAEALDAEVTHISQGGWGVYWGWDASRHSCIPDLYDMVCAHEAAGRVPCDFAANPVDVVVINLGTNDASGVDTLPEAERPAMRRTIAEAAERFVRHVRQVRPGALILWAYGMCDHRLTAELRGTIERLKAEDPNLDYVDLPTAAPDEMGSRMHPGIPSHRRAAELIAGVIRTRLG